MLSRHVRAIAAALAALAGMVFGTLPLAAGAQSLDLGVASHFNAFVFGTFKATDGDTGGPLAAGGSVDLSYWAVNALATGAYQGFALVAGGNAVGFEGKVFGGDSFVGGTVTPSLDNSFDFGAVKSGQSPVDFAAAARSLSALSSSVATARATGTFASRAGGGYFVGSGGDVEVFDLGASDFNAAGFFVASGIQPGATVVVNVAGAALAMNGILDLGVLGDNALFNFYEADAVALRSIDASVLAPFAAVSGFSGNLQGTLVAASFEGLGHFEFHSDPFVATNLAAAVPEPSTAALVGAGWLVTLAALRRCQCRLWAAPERLQRRARGWNVIG